MQVTAERISPVVMQLSIEVPAEAVKTEFEKFGGVLAKVKSQTQTVLNTLDNAETRSRAMGRALKKVEALPDTQAQALIPFDKDFDGAGGDTDADTSA